MWSIQGMWNRAQSSKHLPWIFGFTQRSGRVMQGAKPEKMESKRRIYRSNVNFGTCDFYLEYQNHLVAHGGFPLYKVRINRLNVFRKACGEQKGLLKRSVFFLLFLSKIWVQKTLYVLVYATGFLNTCKIYRCLRLRIFHKQWYLKKQNNNITTIY